MKLACLGDVGVDHYLDDNIKYLGGCSLNLARAFRSILPDSQLSFFGPRLDLLANHPEVLKRNFQFIGPNSNGAIPLQGINISANGEKIFSPYQAGAWENFVLPNQYWKTLIDNDLAVAVCFEQNISYINGFLKWKDSFPSSQKIPFLCMDFLSGADFQFNFELLRPYVEQVDLPVFGIDSSHPSNLKRELEDWALSSKRNLLLTLGENGSLFILGETSQKIVVPALKVSMATDTTGAGDCFLGVFLACWRGKGLPLLESLSCANAIAAEKIQHKGPCHLDVMTLII